MSLNSNNWTPFRFQGTSLKLGITARSREGDTAKAGYSTSVHTEVKSLGHKMMSPSYTQHQEACQYIELFITIFFLYLSGCLGWVFFFDFPLKVWRNKSLSTIAAKEGAFRPKSCVFNPCPCGLTQNCFTASLAIACHLGETSVLGSCSRGFP